MDSVKAPTARANVVTALALVADGAAGLRADSAVACTGGTANRPGRSGPGVAAARLGIGSAVRFDQRIRVVRSDDHDAARVDRGGQRRRGQLERVRVPVEAGRGSSAARVLLA